MSINLSHPLCTPFYAAMKRLDLILLTHTGVEHSIDSTDKVRTQTKMQLHSASSQHERVRSLPLFLCFLVLLYLLDCLCAARRLAGQSAVAARAAGCGSASHRGALRVGGTSVHLRT